MHNIVIKLPIRPLAYDSPRMSDTPTPPQRVPNRRALRNSWATVIPLLVFWWFLLAALSYPTVTTATTQSPAYVISVVLVALAFFAPAFLERATTLIGRRAFAPLQHPSAYGHSLLEALQRTLDESEITSDLRAVGSSSEVDPARRRRTIVIDDNIGATTTVAAVAKGILNGLSRRLGASIQLALLAGITWLFFSCVLYFTPAVAEGVLYLGVIAVSLMALHFVTRLLIPALRLRRTAARLNLLTGEEIRGLSPIVRAYVLLTAGSVGLGVIAIAAQWFVLSS